VGSSRLEISSILAKKSSSSSSSSSREILAYNALASFFLWSVMRSPDPREDPDSLE